MTADEALNYIKTGTKPIPIPIAGQCLAVLSDEVLRLREGKANRATREYAELLQRVEQAESELMRLRENYDLAKSWGKKLLQRAENAEAEAERLRKMLQINV